MSPLARQACNQAVANIHAGNYPKAIACLRDALRETHNPRAWSKLMLALRALTRVVPCEEPPGEDNWPSSDAEMIARNW